MNTKTALLGICDYLLPAMKRGEVSLMFFFKQDILKPLTQTVLTRVYALGFLLVLNAMLGLRSITSLIAASSLKWMTRPRRSRLCCLVSHRAQYLDLLCSTYICLIFKSTLSDLSTSTQTIQLSLFTQRPKDAIFRLVDSSESNLALNEAKTKWMLFSIH